jgi:hypothetical protein
MNVKGNLNVNDNIYSGGTNLLDIFLTTNDGNTYLTGHTFANNILTSTLNDGNTVTATIDNFTSITTSGNITATGNITANGNLLVTGNTTTNGNNITNGNILSGSTNLLDIFALAGASGEVNTASNIGGGEGLFSGKTGVDLEFKSLTSTGGTVTISSTGATVNLEADFTQDYDPRVSSVASTATLTVDTSLYDQAIVTAQAAALTIAAPTGTPVQGRKLIIRIKDNATARALTWNAIFRVIGTTLPTTTVISKTMYIGCIYNSTDTKWDVVAVVEEV